MDYIERIKSRIAGWRDYDKEKQEFPVYTAWLFILASFAVLLILILWFGGMLFFRISQERFWDQRTASIPSRKDVINKDRLEQVTARYAEQREVLETRKQTRLSAEDPS